MASHDESFEKGWGVSARPEPAVAQVGQREQSARRDPEPAAQEGPSRRLYLPWYEWRRFGGRGIQRAAGVDASR